jgi:hypothetical protein
MRLRSFALFSTIAVVFLLASPGLAGPEEDARSAYDLGNRLLASADFPGALRAFATAAKADPSRREYLESFALVRQVMLMQRSLDAGLAPEAWEATARGLHRFYHEYGIHQAALPLDRQIHERLASVESATMLASTLLELDRPEEAEGLLSSIDRAEARPHSDALLGIALAHQRKLEPAAAVAARIEVPTEADPALLYDLARLQCLIGRSNDSLVTLAHCFESTPPSELERVKIRARACGDFSTMASKAAFASVLETQSKVAQSSCSGGASCGSCSMKGSCGMTKPEGGCEMEKKSGEGAKRPDTSAPQRK